jgi:surface polysaccharide O-acyltransferase-like enzyme
MYLFLPLINKGISLIYKSELIIIILSMIGILFIWKDLMSRNPNQFCSNTSTKTLLVYFIIGAYFGKYNLNDKKNKSIFYYLYMIILFCSTSYTTNYLMYYKDFSKYKLILKKILYNRTNSIAMVLQSTSIILIFIKIKYNKSISKIISFLGSLSFSSYLIHNHMDLRPILIPYLFQKSSSSLSFQNLIILFLIKGTLVFIACIFIDYLRFLLFSFFRITQICLYFEKLIFSLCSRINEN